MATLTRLLAAASVTLLMSCGSLHCTPGCATGFVCVENDVHAAVCVDGTAICSGLAGLPCSTGSTCVDDPRDACDPLRGGADCGGLCVASGRP
jgi:hypothetical protein